MIFNQLITEEPKYQAKALIVATDTINSGGSCSGNFPSLLYGFVSQGLGTTKFTSLIG